MGPSCGVPIGPALLALTVWPGRAAGVWSRPKGLKMAGKYARDSLRFIQPVRVGSRVRLHVSVVDVTEKNPGQWLVKAKSTLEIEGSEKPAFIAEGLTLYFV